jgi:Na+-transporting methylmalonyl-CoA/oxaloacetate decarboxylase gamma subunit
MTTDDQNQNQNATTVIENDPSSQVTFTTTTSTESMDGIILISIGVIVTFLLISLLVITIRGIRRGIRENNLVVRIPPLRLAMPSSIPNAPEATHSGAPPPSEPSRSMIVSVTT